MVGHVFQQVLLLHVFSLFFLTGLIWVIQLVHYPSFLLISNDRFSEFHALHSQRITWIVAPMMFLELITAAILLFQIRDSFWVINLISVLLAWFFTGFISVPLHNRIAAKLDFRVINRLVITNWLRTATWSVRSTAWLILIGSFLQQNSFSW